MLVDELSNTDSIIMVETIPLEAKLFHTDNLHLNDEGLRQISGLILSALYRVIAPDMYRPKRNYISPRLNHAQHHAASSSLILGCWNVEYFRSAQIQFRSLLNLFSILAISEHCLHEEQLDFLKNVTDDSYNYTAVSANDNPPLLSGKPAHGGDALFWKCSFDNFISPLKNINSDRIVGIRCNFPNSTPLFILGVYLPASHNITEFNEYFDHLWALYDSLSVNLFVIIMGDFNGDLGNSLSDKAKHEPDQHGQKIARLY